ncbi:hypothetical protein [Pleionea sediminis]|uniref:hypothetical protein n=1 Tax=Pleionea sediminis TaxID=2569479 RepID=UPI001185E271|nr:hypothetical protein [Pleionea sediminis]
MRTAIIIGFVITVGLVAFGVNLSFEYKSPPESKTQIPSSKKTVPGSEVPSSMDVVSTSASSIATVNEQAEKLMLCLEEESCDYPQTDPRSYGYALGKDMIQLMVSSQQAMVEGNLDTFQLRKIGLTFLSVPDGHVQAKAISVLNTLPVDSETFVRVDSVLNDHFDSVLLEKSLSFLLRYHTHGFGNEVDRLLQKQIRSGGHFSRQMLSAKILPFINESNVESYRSTANSLSQQSLEYRQLTTVLKEYQLFQQGG